MKGKDRERKLNCYQSDLDERRKKKDEIETTAKRKKKRGKNMEKKNKKLSRIFRRKPIVDHRDQEEKVGGSIINGGLSDENFADPGASIGVRFSVSRNWTRSRAEGSDRNRVTRLSRPFQAFSRNEE